MSARFRPWSRHYLDVWHERAADPRLPLWLRVAALCYGSHDAYGHARFKPGQVAIVLGSIDTTTGEFRSLHKGHVQRAIGTAVEYGWLEASSGSLCLVAPVHGIRGGVGGSGQDCPLHNRKGRRGTSLSDVPEAVSTPLSDVPGSHSVVYSQAPDQGKRARSLESVLSLSERAPA